MKEWHQVSHSRHKYHTRDTPTMTCTHGILTTHGSLMTHGSLTKAYTTIHQGCSSDAATGARKGGRASKSGYSGGGGAT